MFLESLDGRFNGTKGQLILGVGLALTSSIEPAVQSQRLFGAFIHTPCRCKESDDSSKTGLFG